VVAVVGKAAAINLDEADIQQRPAFPRDHSPTGQFACKAGPRHKLYLCGRPP
jgi:hypothetical protein